MARNRRAGQRGGAGLARQDVAEIITGRLAARRAFVDKTTGQISDLAKEHYWALANHASVLGAALEEYLYIVDYHLLLEFNGPDVLEERLNIVAKMYADRTFYDLCRLIWLFKKFQFDGSNTYLLTTDSAGRACRQFYNNFISVLPLTEESAQLDILAILDVMHRRQPAGGSDTSEIGKKGESAETGKTKKSAETGKAEKPLETGKKETPPTGHEFSVKEFISRFVDPPGDLADVKEAYRLWLRSRLDNVTLAAQALRAYNELLSHELANLYRGWFKHQAYSALPFAKAVAYDQWPEILSRNTAGAIAQALTGSELLQSLAGDSAKKSQKSATGPRDPDPNRSDEGGPAEQASGFSPAKGRRVRRGRPRGAADAAEAERTAPAR